MNRFEKLKLALRYYLLGKGYFQTLDALEFAANFHRGVRKDNTTPEFQHQIEIAHYVRTLPDLIHREETLTASLLHDVQEDYDVSKALISQQFGERVATAVDLLDKTGKTEDMYFIEISNDPIASIVKGADRIHNLQTMVGVFTHERQGKYVQAVELHFLPMIKSAKRTFVRQEAAYENIKHMLVSQVELIKHVHKSYWITLQPAAEPQQSSHADLES